MPTLNPNRESSRTRDARERAVALIGAGLTPMQIEAAVRFPNLYRATVERFGATEADIEWLAQRWPVQHKRRD